MICGCSNVISPIVAAPILVLAFCFAPSSFLFSDISAMNGGIFYNSYSNPNYTISLSNNNYFSDVHTSAWGAILFTQVANISINGNTFSNTNAAIGGSIVYANKTNFDPTNFWVDNTLVGGQETNVLLPITLAPNTFDIELIIDAPIEKIENYFINDGSYMLIRNISTYSLKNANFSIVLKYSNGNLSQIVPSDGSEAQVLTYFTTFKDSIQGSLFHKLNESCSTSHCRIDATKVILAGTALSFLKVDINYYQAINKENMTHNIIRTFYLQLRAGVPGELNNSASGDPKLIP